MSFKRFVLICEYESVKTILEHYGSHDAVLSIDVNKVSHVGDLFPIRFDPTREQAKVTLLLRAENSNLIREHISSHIMEQFAGRVIFYVISLPDVQTHSVE